MDESLRECLYSRSACLLQKRGNHAVLYAMGETADEVDTKLISALHELRLISGSPFAKEEFGDGTL